MKNTIESLVGKIVYYGYPNGQCYSGELELESIKRHTRYVIKRAIAIQYTDCIPSITVYIDEDKIDRISGPNIYIKQEENKGN